VPHNLLTLGCYNLRPEPACPALLPASNNRLCPQGQACDDAAVEAALKAAFQDADEEIVEAAVKK
jgi:hypothetical protein